MKTYLATPDEKELERVTPGKRGQVWQVLLHLINYATYHRAQSNGLLGKYDAPTFDQDIIVPFCSRTKKER